MIHVPRRQSVEELTTSRVGQAPECRAYPHHSEPAHPCRRQIQICQGLAAVPSSCPQRLLRCSHVQAAPCAQVQPQVRESAAGQWGCCHPHWQCRLCTRRPASEERPHTFTSQAMFRVYLIVTYSLASGASRTSWWQSACKLSLLELLTRKVGGHLTIARQPRDGLSAVHSMHNIV